MKGNPSTFLSFKLKYLLMTFFALIVALNADINATFISFLFIFKVFIIETTFGG